MNRDHSTPAWLQGAAAPAEAPSWTDQNASHVAPAPAEPTWTEPIRPAAPPPPHQPTNQDLVAGALRG
ncbi:hypothetical protein ACFWPB_06650, partial [Rhodococcus sp. NPDC058514]